MEPYVVRVEYKITDSMKYIPKVTLRKDNFPLKLYGFLKYIFFQFKQSKSTTKFFPDDNLFLIYNSEYYDCLNTFKQILSTSNNGLRDFHLNEQNFLPKINYERPNCPLNPDFIYQDKNDYFKAVIEKNLTNQQRWHCYSLRFRDSKNINIPTGYAEITPPIESDYNEVYARIVYNYVENKIYYTPYHYRPYICTDEIVDKKMFFKNAF